MEKNEPPARNSLFRAFRSVIAGTGALIFLFGDRFLREIWHVSFLTSIIIWVGALGILLILGIILSHLCDS